MKKLGFAIVIFVLMVSFLSVAFADGGIESKGIYIGVYADKNPDFRAEDVTFSLYSEDGVKLGEDTFFLCADDTTYVLYYDVDFVTGDKFLLELTKGAQAFEIGGKEIPLYNYGVIETYAMLNEENEVVIGNRFDVNLKSGKDIPMDMYIKGSLVNSKNSIKSLYGVPFCEMYKLIEYLYLDKDCLTVDGDTVTVAYDGKTVSVTVGKDEVVYGDGTRENIGANAWYYGGKTYVPIIPFAKTFSAEFKEYKSDFAYDMDIYPKKIKDAENFVIKNGIDSKTNYLIWISKKDFRLHLFKGEKGNWHLTDSYPCTIGAPSTPTITGQFDYIEKIPKWYYQKYYVGPVMRFHNGYAIHTVLLKYDGTEYDGRVEKKLSLGCIRVKKNVMEYLAKTVPLKTKIFITE